MVKWVVVSDLHAGGLTSLLGRCGDDDTTGQAVVNAFAAAFGPFMDHLDDDDPAQLVLLGDVLDLQFSKRSAATRDALPFLQALRQTGRFADTVMATAGNHDHAIWADARLGLEAQAFIDGREHTPHTTAAFDAKDGAQSALLTALLDRAGFPSVDLRYPNIALSTDKRIVVMHHGHYIEGAYRVVSAIKDALCARDGQQTVETLCAENANWIDFAWSPFNGARDRQAAPRPWCVDDLRHPRSGRSDDIGRQEYGVEKRHGHASGCAQKAV